MAVAISTGVKLPVAVTISRMRVRSRGSSWRMTKVASRFRSAGGGSRLGGGARHRLDSDGGDRGAVVEVDVLHRIVAVVVAVAVDVVILHEQHHRHPGVGKDL